MCYKNKQKYKINHKSSCINPITWVTSPHYAKILQPGGGQQSRGEPEEAITQFSWSPIIYKNFSSTAPLKKTHLPRLLIEEFSNLLQITQKPK